MPDREKVIKNTIELVRYLMQKYNITADKVKRHFDYNGKVCPSILAKNNWQGWHDFKAKLVNTESEYDKAVDILVKKGIISSPDIWKEDKFNVNNVHSLVIKISKKV